MSEGEESPRGGVMVGGNDVPVWNVFRPDEYEALLEEAVCGVKQQFADFLSPDKRLDVYASPPEGFRLRAKFLVTGNEGDGSYDSDDESLQGSGDMLPPLKHAGWHQGQPFAVEEYPIAAPRVQQAMPRVIHYLSCHPMLRSKLRGVQYLSTMSGDLLVTLVYERRKLGGAWQVCADTMRTELEIDFIAQSKGVERLIGGRKHVSETLEGPDGSSLHYMQIAGNFSNPNGHMAQHTLRWLASCAEDVDGLGTDLLELYCGCGNHTIAMSKYFRRVLGVEINRKLVSAAHVNLKINDTKNCWVLRAPSETFCSSMMRHRTWRVALQKYAKESAPSADEVPDIDKFLRAQEEQLSEEERAAGAAIFDFGAVIVDPPRAGLDEVTAKLISRYPLIAYISCNPKALLRDLHRLTATHSVLRMAVFDHFPYTGHLECGALLKRNTQS